MMSLNAKIEHINLLFQNDYIKVDAEWLLGCVEWFLSESPNISNAELYQQSKQQWLLSPIIESGRGCFPTTILDATAAITLDGHYPVQMQYCLDIAESPYDQLRTLYNQQLDEADEEIQRRQPTAQSKKKRVLKLEITDGHATVIAMEFSPIACLSTKLSPGSKMLLIGPIRCVNKVLLLEPKNVRLLGGEMEALLITNAYENVLLRLLGKPENPNPKTEYHEPVVDEQPSARHPVRETRQPSAMQQSIIVPAVVRQQNFAADIAFEDDDDMLLSNVVDMVEQSCRPPNPDNGHSSLLADDDDDLWLADTEIPTEMPVVKTTPPSRRSPPPSIPICIEDDDVDDDIDMLLDLEANIEHEFRAEQAHHESQLHTVAGGISRSDPQPLAAAANVVAAPESQPSISATNYPYKIRSCNLLTIDQLTSVEDTEKRGKCFIVKANVNNFFERIQISHDLWSLGAFLSHSESTSMLPVRFNDTVLSKLIQYTGKEMTHMKNNFGTKPQLRERCKLIIDQLKEILMELHCFMRISYLTDTEFPIVIECIDSAPVLERIWSNKLVAEEL